MTELRDPETVLDPALFRGVLGQFPTGVVVVTAMGDSDEPLGMTVGSFTSVSLDPPLVAFLPSKTSSSWRSIRESGTRFCVNVLHADQESLCRAVATRKKDKFDGFAWRRSPGGNPVLDGAVAWIDCEATEVHDAGDHVIVVGEVRSLGLGSPGQPLLFFRGGYGSFAPLSLAAADADLLGHLRLIDVARPHMDDLASRLRTEVTAIALVGDDLVLAAAAGHADIAVAPTRVGQRLPFAAPIGSCFAAWGDDATRRRWIAPVAATVSPQQREALLRVPDLVRQRGYAIAVGHEQGAHLEEVATKLNAGDPQIPAAALHEAMVRALEGYNTLVEPDEPIELRSLSAPVFGAGGRVTYMLTLWGRPGLMTKSEVQSFVQELLDAAAASSRAIYALDP